MSDNGSAIDTFVTNDQHATAISELVQEIVELQEAFNIMRQAVNTQAEVLGLHRYVLETALPSGVLEKAAKEYKDARLREIQTKTVPMAQA